MKTKTESENLTSRGHKKVPGWLKLVIGVAIFFAKLWRENRIADHKAEKEQETDKKKSDLRKEESSQDSAQRIQESKEKTIDAMNLDDHRTNNKIRVIQAQGKEDRATLLLKQNSRNNVASVVDEIDVEPTFPTSTFDVETDDGEEYGDGPLVKRGGVNIFTGIPGTGKTNFANQFGFHQCGMLQSGLFDDGDPSSTITYYLYDYEMGQGFNKRYSNLVPHNFYRCDMQEKAKNHNDVNVVYSLDYLNKQIKEDLEYPTSDVIMVIDCKGKISNMKGRDVEFITRLQQFIKEYKVKTNHILTFILIEHLNPHMSRSTNFLDVSQIKGSQGYNEFADQTILIGSTGVNGCIRVKVAKNRWGVSQDSTIHLFQRTDKVFFNYIGEYDEKQVLASKNGSNMSLEEFRKTVKPTSTPTFTKKNKSSVAGRPINLTLSTCQAMLNARSQGKSKNEVSRLYGFTRQAYNEALKRYGLVDDYPDGNWKP